MRIFSSGYGQIPAFYIEIGADYWTRFLEEMRASIVVASGLVIAPVCQQAANPAWQTAFPRGFRRRNSAVS
jgi:hypothetical protein